MHGHWNAPRQARETEASAAAPAGTAAAPLARRHQESAPRRRSDHRRDRAGNPWASRGGRVRAAGKASRCELVGVAGACRKPYPPLGDAKVALTSWRWLLKLPNIDQTQIVQFVRSHYADPNYAPEANIQ